MIECYLYIFCLTLKISSVTDPIVTQRTKMPSLTIFVFLLADGPTNIFCI